MSVRPLEIAGTTTLGACNPDRGCPGMLRPYVMQPDQLPPGHVVVQCDRCHDLRTIDMQARKAAA